MAPILRSHLRLKLIPNVKFNNKPTIVKHVPTFKGNFTLSLEWFLKVI